MPGSSSRVPLVRCPKCGHLLPELPPYSVYCCGSCGAYLRAEKGSSVDDLMSENSFERAGEGSEREISGEILGVDPGRADEMPAAPARSSKSVRSRYGGAIRKSPIGGSNLGDSDAQSKSSGRSMDGDARKPPLTENRSGGLDGRGKLPPRSVRQGFRKAPMTETVLGDSDEQRSMGSDVVANYEEMEAREKVGAWFDHVKEEAGFANLLDVQKGFDYEAIADESELNMPRVSPRRRTWSLDESPVGFGSIPIGGRGVRRADQIVDDLGPEYDDSYAMRRVAVPHDDWVHGGDHGMPRRHREMRVQDGYVGGFRGSNRAPIEQQRFPVYPNEGYGYDQSSSRHSQESYMGSPSVQNVEMNRAEAFHLYNDLKEQLTITGDLPGNPVRRGHHRISSADCYGGPDDYVHDEPLRLRRPAASVDLDERARMSPHYMDRGRADVPPSRFVPKEFPFDDDPSWPQVPGRTPHNRRHYPRRSSHEYIPGHSVDSTYDPSGLNHRREGLHHPTCSCSLCHPRQPLEQAPAAFGYRRYPDSPIHAASDFPDPHGQRASGPRFPNSTHGRSSNSRSSVESKSDEGGSVKEHKKRALVVNQNQLLCHPIAGAAPFVICHNCSQLLRLPKKLITMKKTRHSLQCGSCHTALSFDFNRKNSNVSTQLQPKPDSADVYDEPSKTSESEQKNTHDISAGIANRESYDFDANGYTFPSTDSEPSMRLMPDLKEAETKQVLRPSSSNASRDDPDLSNAVNKTDASNPLMSNIPPRPPPGATLKEHFDYSAMFSIKKSDETETDVSYHDDKEMTDRDSSSLNYLQNEDGRAELDINTNEAPKLDTSRSSADASRKEDESSFASISGRGSKLEVPKLDMSRSSADASSKRGESFFASISGRSSKDLSPPHDALNTKTNVFVNGHPLAHRLVRKAEKLAGPISPGNYWYDSRAGFWGIMGGCCLGIIPPFIEEFGFPIPVDCAGGNTGICVNGRELHEKDLEVLASRGFPRTSNKSYVIDISGKVEDEETGDVVCNLGKLAPTVEKTKRGFGMQPPEMQEE